MAQTSYAQAWGHNSYPTALFLPRERTLLFANGQPALPGNVPGMARCLRPSVRSPETLSFCDTVQCTLPITW